MTNQESSEKRLMSYWAMSRPRPGSRYIQGCSKGSVWAQSQLQMDVKLWHSFQAFLQLWVKIQCKLQAQVFELDLSWTAGGLDLIWPDNLNWDKTKGKG